MRPSNKTCNYGGKINGYARYGNKVVLSPYNSLSLFDRHTRFWWMLDGFEERVTNYVNYM